MIAFHGTSKLFANNITGSPNKVNVTIGGGELGRGFYLGESVALAASFAKSRHGTEGVVLKFDIDDSSYVKLSTLILRTRQYVYRLWQSFFNRRKTNVHLFNVDVVCAPFSTIDFSYQYKFESKMAENTLNYNSNIQIL